MSPAMVTVPELGELAWTVTGRLDGPAVIPADLP
jgi:hypothetical protein